MEKRGSANNNSAEAVKILKKYLFILSSNSVTYFCVDNRTLTLRCSSHWCPLGGDKLALSVAEPEDKCDVMIDDVRLGND